MNRTITIKGVGRLSLKPDQVAVTLCLKTTDPVYEEAMRAATGSSRSFVPRSPASVLPRTI